MPKVRKAGRRDRRGARVSPGPLRALRDLGRMHRAATAPCPIRNVLPPMDDAASSLVEFTRGVTFARIDLVKAGACNERSIGFATQATPGWS